MTALSANRSIDVRNTGGQMEGTAVIATSSVIYQNALVVQEDDGLGLVPAADTATTTFLGMAIRTSTGTFPCTGDGTRTCTYVFNIEAKLPMTGLTAGNAQAVTYCLDDAGVTSTNSKGPVAGPLSEYDATNSGWIWLRGGVSAKASS